MQRLFLVDAAAFEHLKPAVDEIADTVSDPNLYHNIQQSLASSGAFLFMASEGFVVLKPIRDNGILIWVAHRHTYETEAKEFQIEIERLASWLNAKYLQMWSVRKGWFRILPAWGYTHRPNTWYGKPITVWEKQL